jgi:hypothetical protein
MLPWGCVVSPLVAYPWKQWNVVSETHIISCHVAKQTSVNTFQCDHPLFVQHYNGLASEHPTPCGTKIQTWYSNTSVLKMIQSSPLEKTEHSSMSNKFCSKQNWLIVRWAILYFHTGLNKRPSYDACLRSLSDGRGLQEACLFAIKLIKNLVIAKACSI